MEATAFPPFELEMALTKETDREFRGLDGSWEADGLMALIESLKDFVVVDVASKEYLGHIVHQLDTVRDTMSGDCETAIHFACPCNDRRLPLLKGLLQLGADPDVLDPHGVSLSEYCSRNALRAAADVIRKCRPRAATRQVESKGFPSLAHLAHDQEWWAVHNLCRRNVVPRATVNRSYKGKTAVGWARFHGQRLVLAELLYLLKPNLLGETTPDCTRRKRSHQEMEETKETFLLAVAEMDQEREKLKNEIASLTSENMALKKEGAEQKAELAAQAAEVSTLKVKVRSAAIAGLQK